MVLSSEEAIRLIKEPANPAKLSRAKTIQKRLNFHAQIVEDKQHCSSYYSDFIAFVGTILKAKDKLDQFEKLLRFPLKTNKVVDEIADEYKKVFNAQNSLKQYTLRTPELTHDFQQYLESIRDKDFWESKVFSSMLTAINSIVVIDMAAEPSADIKPYPSIVDIDCVVDLATSPKDGKIEYLIFNDGNGLTIVLDDQFYRAYKKRDGSDEYVRIVENPHSLGFTPAKYMWEDVLDNRNQDVKHSPIASILEDLDWYLFFETAKKSLDLYAAYPIYWAFKDRSCDFTPKGGTQCRSGFVHNSNGEREPCPACEKQSFLNGPGSFVRPPMPKTKEQPELREPIGYVSADTDSLDYNVGESKRLKASIIEAATGKMDFTQLSKEAMNEDQIRSQFEAQTNILTYLAENYEKINKWTVDTIGKLRYDSDYLGSSINYGTEFYLKSIEEVTDEYKVARDSGLPTYILLSKRNQIEELQNKNNPSERERNNVLKFLEPYPDYNINSLISLGIRELDFFGFITKVNFVTLINDFELKHGSIVEWGSALNFEVKIERIKKILNDYVREKFKQPEPAKQTADS